MHHGQYADKAYGLRKKVKVMSKRSKKSIIEGIASLFDITGRATVDIDLSETSEEMIKKYLGDSKDDKKTFSDDMKKAYQNALGIFDDQKTGTFKR